MMKRQIPTPQTLALSVQSMYSVCSQVFARFPSLWVVYPLVNAFVYGDDYFLLPVYLIRIPMLGGGVEQRACHSPHSFEI